MQKEKLARKGTLVAFRPRLNADADTMFRPSLDNMVITDGHKIRPWRERDDSHHLVSILGQEVNGLLAPGFQIINLEDPEGKLQIDGISRLVHEGSYVVPDGKRKPVLTYVNEDDDYFYLRWSSGFIPTEVSFEGGPRKRGLLTDPDFIELLHRGINPVTHGFHDLGGSNSVLATEAGIEFTGPDSKRLWSSVGRDRVTGTDIPHMRSDLIRIAKGGGGGQGVFRDIDGTFGRIVVEKGQLAVVDASDPKYVKFFDLAEERRRNAAAARREQRRLQKEGAQPQGELFRASETVEIPVEEPAAADKVAAA